MTFLRAERRVALRRAEAGGGGWDVVDIASVGTPSL